MHFETGQLQRYYELITDQYYAAYHRFLAEADDDEDDAYYRAREAGYELITNDKELNGALEFATTFVTPTYIADVWYKKDSVTGKKMFDNGFIRIKSK